MSTLRPHIGLLTLQPPDWQGAAAARLIHGTVSSLRSAGCRVTVFTRGKQPNESRHSPPDSDLVFLNKSNRRRSSFCQRLVNRLKPFGANQTAEEVDILRAKGPSLDWLIAEETYSGWLAEKARIPTILHSHCLRSLDLEELPQSTTNESKIKRMLAAEPKIIRRFTHHATASTRVAQKIKEWHPRGEVSPVNLSIDLSHYSFVSTEKRSRTTPTANLFGSMSWAATADTANQLVNEHWPQIKSQVPTAKLQIVGRGTHKFVHPSASIVDVELHDWVEDILPFWEKAGILLYPCDGGSGIKLKVLEALAYGIPIVTTPSGAEGINLVDGETAMIARTKSEFVERSITLLKSHELQEKLRHAGRHFLETKLAPSRVASSFLEAGIQLKRYLS